VEDSVVSLCIMLYEDSEAVALATIMYIASDDMQ